LFIFILRAHNYERFPSPNHLDEQLYALSGIYLVETGVPVSWSTLDYPKSAEVYKGTISYQGGEPSASVTLYKPWLDEPPLFLYWLERRPIFSMRIETDLSPQVILDCRW